MFESVKKNTLRSKRKEFIKKLNSMFSELEQRAELFTSAKGEKLNKELEGFIIKLEEF